MKEGSRANALLVELLLVIFFFMIGASILVQLFADAKLKSRQARATTVSIAEAQNLAEDLYGAKDPEALLAEQGYEKTEDGWSIQGDDYIIYVTETDEETEGGVLRTFRIESVRNKVTLFTIPSTRYLPKEVSP